jgi:osmotically-inducible protein OsmY
MRNDFDIERDVEAELRWDPHVDATDIAVNARDGVVALTGFVHDYGQRWAAEEAVKRLVDVVGVANDIEVRVPKLDTRPDPEIAREAVQAIHYHLPNGAKHIKAIVRDGWITLEGKVDCYLYRHTAESAVRTLRGIKGVSNSLRVTPPVKTAEVKHEIEEAFKRNAQIDADHVAVETVGREVILKGTVQCWAELREAERAAGAAPGVTHVDNRLIIAPKGAFTTAA